MFLKSWIVALFWLVFSAWACAQTNTVQRFEQAQISWQASASPPNLYEAELTPLPSDWGRLRPEYAGQAWYRIRFDAAPSDVSAVLIERACTHAHIWLNGSLVKRSGSLHDPISRQCYYPHWANLPAQLLKPQGNVLDIQLAGYAFSQVAARQRHAGLSPVLLGSEQQLRSEYERLYFWNITVAQIIGVSITFFGLVLLMLFAVRRQDRYFLYFGLTLIGWALIGIRLYWQEIPLPGWMTEILITSLFPIVVACAIQFLLHYVSRPQVWVARALWVQAITVPLVMLLMGSSWIFRLGSAVFTLLAVQFLLALLYAGWQAWRHMRTDFWVMGSALAMASVMVVAEIAIQNAWLPLPNIHLIHFGLPWVFLAITVRLVQQFAQSLNRSERLAVELEQRVAQKTQEITANYEQISHLRANEAAQQERHRIAADLHDDLGAKLLSIIHTDSAAAQKAGGLSAATMARQALDEMRLSVRGLTAQVAPAWQVLADWRAEAMERLHTAGLQADWYADEPLEQVNLGARIQVQLTRILRESISNVLF